MPEIRLIKTKEHTVVRAGASLNKREIWRRKKSSLEQSWKILYNAKKY